MSLDGIELLARSARASSAETLSNGKGGDTYVCRRGRGWRGSFLMAV